MKSTIDRLNAHIEDNPKPNFGEQVASAVGFLCVEIDVLREQIAYERKMRTRSDGE